MEDLASKKRVREESDESPPFDSPEVKKIREDLLGFLDDSDLDPATHDLDSVMKSFADEISSSPAPVIDLTSDSGESQPELGYLLGASDDELGLPPSGLSSSENKNEGTELIRVESGDSVGIGGLWGFEDGMPSYDSFELGGGGVENYGNDYVAFDDGLFEYSNVCFDSSEFPDFPWRLGGMPAAE